MAAGSSRRRTAEAAATWAHKVAPVSAKKRPVCDAAGYGVLRRRAFGLATYKTFLVKRVGAATLHVAATPDRRDGVLVRVVLTRFLGRQRRQSVRVFVTAVRCAAVGARVFRRTFDAVAATLACSASPTESGGGRARLVIGARVGGGAGSTRVENGRALVGDTRRSNRAAVSADRRRPACAARARAERAYQKSDGNNG